MVVIFRGLPILKLSAAGPVHAGPLLVRHATGSSGQRLAEPDVVKPGTLRLINSLPETPAVVVAKSSDVLAWNRLGHRLIATHLEYDAPGNTQARPNLVRLLFLDEHYRKLYTRWEEEATRAVSSLRLVVGSTANDPELAGLVHDLSAKSSEFADVWAQHPVVNCMTGLKYFHHPDVGELMLNFEVLTPPDDSGHRILMYTAEAGSHASKALQQLASAAGVSEGLYDAISALNEKGRVQELSSRVSTQDIIS